MYNRYQEYNFDADEILVYLRKSRSDDPLLTVEEVLERHETILNEWAEKNLGAKIPEANKFREVVSGETIADRPEVQKLLRLIENPRYKAILIVEVQRLSRGDLEDAGRLIKLLRYTNTAVITPLKTYNFSDEYDRDIFERELKRGNEFLEYTKKILLRGRLLSVQQGNFIGNTAPYGYRKVWIQDGKEKFPTLEIYEPEAAVVKTIYELYIHKNMGVTNICHYLDKMNIAPANGGHWSSATVRDILRNIHYTGKVKWNNRKTVTTVEDGDIVHKRPRNKDVLIFDGKHPAIITDELFKAAEAKQGKNTRVKSNTKLSNPFAGLIRCSCGGSVMIRKYSHNGVQLPPRLLCKNQVHCHTGSCSYEEITKLIADVLRKQIHNFDLQIKNVEKNNTKTHEQLIDTLKKKLKELDAKEIAQWEAQTDPSLGQRMPPEVFKVLNAKLQDEKENTRKALTNALTTLPTVKHIIEKRTQFVEALNAIYDTTLTAEQKNLMIKACIEKIIYRREQPIRTTVKDSKKQNGWTNPAIKLSVKLKI